MFSLPSKFKKQYCNDVILFKTIKPDGSQHPIQVAWGLRKNGWVLPGQLHKWYSKKNKLARYWFTGLLVQPIKLGLISMNFRATYLPHLCSFFFSFFFKCNNLSRTCQISNIKYSLIFLFFILIIR